MKLQCTDWEVFPPNVPGEKWSVGRTYDTASSAALDAADQSICFGAAFDIDSEHTTKEAADKRCEEIKGTMPKAGYEMV